MDHFYGEDWYCDDCTFSGAPEKVFEPSLRSDRDGVSDIIFVCPTCGFAEIQGERFDGEEFFY